MTTPDGRSFAPSDAMQFIGGARSVGAGAVRSSQDPATSEILATYPDSALEDLDRAVDSARRHQAGWAALPPTERGRILRRAADLLRQRNEELARWEVLDTGKPIREALVTDVHSAADCLEYYGGVIVGLAGEHHQLGTLMAYTRREPLGVVGAIGAWNYPLQISAWKAAPALAAGNAVVVKPSEQTPLTTVALAEVLADAGLPSGVFSVVQGDATIGSALAAHAGVDKVTVTGSVPTGRAVMRSAAGGPVPVTLELGGKSPLIVFADADLDRAVQAAVVANFATQGEVCSNGTRVFVEEPLRNEFVERFADAARSLVVGDPLDPATQVGSLISDAHLAKVLAAIRRGQEQGAVLVTGGEHLVDGALSRGRFISPAVFDRVADDSDLACDEIFGPVASVLGFRSEHEVVQRANASPYGLGAGVMTRDLDRAHRVAAALDAGLVWVNTYNVTPVELPFGGVKASGLGRENGWAGLEAVTRIKTVMVESAPLDGL